MRPITPETPRKDILVGGLVFKAPTPFAEGDVLTANEAAAINQTYLENVGNNFRSAVIAAKRAFIAGPNASPEAIKAVTDEQVKALDKAIADGSQKLPDDTIASLTAAFDELVSKYQMGVRRTSSVTVYSPEEKVARELAKKMLTEALKAKGIKLNTVKAEWYEREIAKLLDKENPIQRGNKNVTEGLWKAAARRVALEQQAAAEGLDELDLTDMTKESNETA